MYTFLLYTCARAASAFDVTCVQGCSTSVVCCVFCSSRTSRPRGSQCMAATAAMSASASDDSDWDAPGTRGRGVHGLEGARGGGASRGVGSRAGVLPLQSWHGHGDSGSDDDRAGHDVVRPVLGLLQRGTYLARQYVRCKRQREPSSSAPADAGSIRHTSAQVLSAPSDVGRRERIRPRPPEPQPCNGRAV